MAQLNCQSAICKLPTIESLLQQHDIDVLFLCETWFNSSLPDAVLSIAGYTTLRRDRVTAVLGCSGGGVAVYIKAHLMPSVCRCLDLESSDLEDICIRYAQPRGQPLTFHMFYRPPHHDVTERNEFFEKLKKTLYGHPSHLPLVIIGDFNAKFTGWNSTDSTTTEGTLLSTVLDDIGLLQLLHDAPTRYSPTGKGSLLDLVITNVEHLVTDLCVLPAVSDHCPVLMSVLAHTQCMEQSNIVMIPDYAHTDFHELREHLWWQPLLECMAGATCVESAWTCWYEYFSQSVSTYVPMRPLIHRKNNNKLWFTSWHRAMSRRRDRLFRKARRVDTVEAWVAYKVYRNTYQAVLRRDKTTYYKNLSQRVQNEKKLL